MQSENNDNDCYRRANTLLGERSKYMAVYKIQFRIIKNKNTANFCLTEFPLFQKMPLVIGRIAQGGEVGAGPLQEISMVHQP